MASKQERVAVAKARLTAIIETEKAREAAQKAKAAREEAKKMSAKARSK